MALWLIARHGIEAAACRTRLGRIIPAMLAGLSLASWALILVSVGAGLAIEIAFLRAHRDRPRGEEHLR